MADGNIFASQDLTAIDSPSKKRKRVSFAPGTREEDGEIDRVLAEALIAQNGVVSGSDPGVHSDAIRGDETSARLNGNGIDSGGEDPSNDAGSEAVTTPSRRRRGGKAAGEPTPASRGRGGRGGGRGSRPRRVTIPTKSTRSQTRSSIASPKTPNNNSNTPQQFDPPLQPDSASSVMSGVTGNPNSSRGKASPRARARASPGARRGRGGVNRASASAGGDASFMPTPTFLPTPQGSLDSIGSNIQQPSTSQSYDTVHPSHTPGSGYGTHPTANPGTLDGQSIIPGQHEHENEDRKPSIGGRLSFGLPGFSFPFGGLFSGGTSNAPNESPNASSLPSAPIPTQPALVPPPPAGPSGSGGLSLKDAMSRYLAGADGLRDQDSSDEEVADQLLVRSQERDSPFGTSTAGATDDQNGVHGSQVLAGNIVESSSAAGLSPEPQTSASARKRKRQDIYIDGDGQAMDGQTGGSPRTREGSRVRGEMADGEVPAKRVSKAQQWGESQMKLEQQKPEKKQKKKRGKVKEESPDTQMVQNQNNGNGQNQPRSHVPHPLTTASDPTSPYNPVRLSPQGGAGVTNTPYFRLQAGRCVTPMLKGFPQCRACRGKIGGQARRCGFWGIRGFWHEAPTSTGTGKRKGGRASSAGEDSAPKGFNALDSTMRSHAAKVGKIIAGPEWRDFSRHERETMELPIGHPNPLRAFNRHIRIIETPEVTDFKQSLGAILAVDLKTELNKLKEVEQNSAGLTNGVATPASKRSRKLPLLHVPRPLDPVLERFMCTACPLKYISHHPGGGGNPFHICQCCGRWYCSSCAEELQIMKGRTPHTKREKLLAKCVGQGEVNHVVEKDFCLVSFHDAEQMEELLERMESSSLGLTGSPSRSPRGKGKGRARSTSVGAGSRSPSSHVNVERFFNNGKEQDAFYMVPYLELTNEVFEAIWSKPKATPILVTSPSNIFTTEDGQQINRLALWQPEALKANYGPTEVVIDVNGIVDRDDRKPPTREFSEMLNELGKKRRYSATWSVTIQWPEHWMQDDFEELYADLLLNLIPVPDHVRPDGILNAGAYLPCNAEADVERRVLTGPRIAVEFASSMAKGGRGSTSLGLVLSDQFNLLTYAKDANGNAGNEVVVWDIFPQEAVPSIRKYFFEVMKSDNTYVEFRNKYGEDNATAFDLLQEMALYLDDKHLEALKTKHNVTPWRIRQHVGEGVFVPADCAFQCCSTADTIQVDSDFLSRHSINRCLQSTENMNHRGDMIARLRLLTYWAWAELDHRQETENQHPS